MCQRGVRGTAEEKAPQKKKKKECRAPLSREERSAIEAVVCDKRYIEEAAEAMEAVMERLTQIGNELSKSRNRKVVNRMSGRAKSVESIGRKIKKKNYPMSGEGVSMCNDLLGVRMVCLFIDDVYDVAARLKECGDFRIVKEKDYICKPKSNGYMSLHLVVDVPVRGEDGFVKDGEDGVLAAGRDACLLRRVEIQLRTLAMDFWSVLDHQLLYKKEFQGADGIGRELKAYAAEIACLDKGMLRLRKKIDALQGGGDP